MNVHFTRGLFSLAIDAPPHSPTPPPRFQFSLLTLLIAVTIAAVIFALGAAAGVGLALLGVGVTGILLSFFLRHPLATPLFALSFILTAITLTISATAPRVSSRLHQCQSQLGNIARAVQMYHDDYGVFPPAYVADETGKPMHSWRVLLLPYLGLEPLYKAYDFSEPWNGPNNRKLLAVPLSSSYTCPTDPDWGRSNTSYLAVVGKNTPLRADRSMSLSEIAQADGAAATLLLVECAESGIHWMEPRSRH